MGWAFLYGPARSKRLSYFASFVVGATWAFAVLPHTHRLEWVAVLLLLLFVGAVAVLLRRPDAPSRGRVNNLVS